MGIPGLLKEIGKGERVALSKFAIDHFERTNRPLRIAVDAAIWNFQNAASQGGRNPALRTLFFRLLKLLALPIHPVFVYDGPKRPLTKRGKTVSRYGTCIENEMAKQLLSLFRFPSHTAPGEAEAECALLQTTGIVDAVMSQDVDAIMFGSTLTLRDWSKEGTYGNKTPTHVSIIDANKVKERSNLDSDGMVMVALLSGGDYDDGVPGFGSGLACEIAKAGFGADLLKLVRSHDEHGLQEWRERLAFELETNESGYFRTRHVKLKLPASFPDTKVLDYYINPSVSGRKDVSNLEARWRKQWESQIDVPALRRYTATMFDWNWKSGARRFVRCFAQPMFQERLRRGLVQTSLYSCDNITGDRKHFVTDGLIELRLSAIPAQVVGLDIEAEEDNPEYAASQLGEGIIDTIDVDDDEADINIDVSKEMPSTPSKRQRMPWNPYAVEKWWIPETLLKIGLGPVVEEWQQKQRDIMADPKKFATRKCVKPRKHAPQIDSQMKTGAIRGFLAHHVSQDDELRSVNTDGTVYNPSVSPVPVPELRLRTPSKRRQKTVSEQPSPSITRFFKTKKAPEALVTEGEDGHDLGLGIYPQNYKGKINEALLQSRFDPSQENNMAPVRSTRLRGTSSVMNNKTRALADEQPDAGRSFVELDICDHMNITKRPRRKIRQPANPQNLHTESDQTPSLQPYALQFFDVHPKPAIPKLVNRKAKEIEKTSSVYAIARDSLPGTWKELDLEIQGQSRPPRISYVDLTGD